MKNMFRKVAAAVAAIAVALTVVTVTDVTHAQAAEYEHLYISQEAEMAAAGVEVRQSFTVRNAGRVAFYVGMAGRTGFTLTLYDSAGYALADANNPLYISSTNSEWMKDGYGNDVNGVVWRLQPGSYSCGVTFDSDQIYYLQITQEKTNAQISQSSATIIAGFTQKLSVSGASVSTWSSSNTAVAVVDQNGKVTARKAGRATISARCTNGQTVTCAVTVRANKYSGRKMTTGDVSYGQTGMAVYSASYDSGGNLVLKARYVNNMSYKVTALKNIRIVVRDGNGKLVGVYSAKKKSMSVPSYTTKNLTFTIQRSKLKQKKANLVNAQFTGDFVSMYRVYY